ncbi:MAG: 4-(cytidine 5'-diphospho)-2-C-methyl-D-erythritol kinase [Chloroflexota bacterium]|nr:4-(cytidine 5'-diphospho)-2-C-methyl-D-erythritol kinase [Chloroflexota bacterium]
MITVPAYAKINLTLEVLGRRSDGYHEVFTVFQEIGLKDDVLLEEDAEIGCEPPEKLVLKAAGLLQGLSRCGRGVAIRIDKGIPVAAGLGGSSSDAAATLRGLDDLWELGLTVDTIVDVGASVSSDTSFFLYGGTALGEGRGERITLLPPLPPCWVVLVRPPVDVPPSKTAALYASLSGADFTNGQFGRWLIDRLQRGAGVDHSCLFNAFERVAFEAFPGLSGYWRRFEELGADGVHLAGSGPSMFTLVEDEGRAGQLWRRLKNEGLETYLVETRRRA